MININTTHVEIVIVSEPKHTSINIFNFSPHSNPNSLQYIYIIWLTNKTISWQIQGGMGVSYLKNMNYRQINKSQMK